MYPYNRIRCERCGRFIATENIGKHRFTPDTHFTGEKDEYWCINCIQKKKLKEKDGD